MLNITRPSLINIIMIFVDYNHLQPMFDIKRSLELLNIPPIPSHEILAVVFTAFPTNQTGELWLLLSYPQQKPITAPSSFRQAAGWPSVHKRHASHSSPRALKRRSWDLLKRGANGSGVVTHTLYIYIGHDMMG